MESITIKVSDDMAAEIEKAMKPGYTTKSEFVRAALRDKVEQIKKTESGKELRKYLGILKTKTSDEELRRIRETAYKQLAKKKGWPLD